MTSSTSSRSARHAGRTRTGRSRWRRQPTHRHIAACVGAAFLLAVVPAIAAPPTDTASADEAFRSIGAQTLTVSDGASVTVTRDAYTATPISDSFTTNASNYDWAKLVLFSAGWPQTTENVTVIVRWMRQENGPPNWFNRNNPLNNGFGSGGGGGTGTYANLVISAQMAAANLKRPLFATIGAAFAAGDDASATEHAMASQLNDFPIRW